MLLFEDIPGYIRIYQWILGIPGDIRDIRGYQGISGDTREYKGILKGYHDIPVSKWVSEQCVSEHVYNKI